MQQASVTLGKLQLCNPCTKVALHHATACHSSSARTPANAHCPADFRVAAIVGAHGHFFRRGALPSQRRHRYRELRRQATRSHAHCCTADVCDARLGANRWLPIERVPPVSSLAFAETRHTHQQFALLLAQTTPVRRVKRLGRAILDGRVLEVCQVKRDLFLVVGEEKVNDVRVLQAGNRLG